MRFRGEPVLDKSNGTVLTKQVPLCVFMCICYVLFSLIYVDLTFLSMITVSCQFCVCVYLNIQFI
jgi:hypothetical protein